MSKFIREEDLVEALYQAIRTNLENPFLDSTHLAIDSMTLAKAMAKNIPSVEPEKKKGKWQRRKGNDCWECSECHAVMESDDFVRHNFSYCYHCGADMMNEDGYMRLEGTEHE